MAIELWSVVLGGMLALIPALVVSVRLQRAMEKQQSAQWRREDRLSIRGVETDRLKDNLSQVEQYISETQDILGLITQLGAGFESTATDAIVAQLPRHSASGTRARIALMSIEARVDTFQIVSKITNGFDRYFTLASETRFSPKAEDPELNEVQVEITKDVVRLKIAIEAIEKNRMRAIVGIGTEDSKR